MACLLLFRATLRNMDFFLAHEMANIGGFDVIFTEEKTKQVYFFATQFDIEKNPVNCNSFFPKKLMGRKIGNFSLFRYLQAYDDIRKKIPGNHHYIIYTNQPLSDDYDEMLQRKDVILPEFIDLNRNNQKLPKFQYYTILNRRNNGQVVKFKPKNKTVIKKLLDYINRTCNRKIISKDVCDFFENLTFFFNQPDETRDLIDSEMYRYIKSVYPRCFHPIINFEMSFIYYFELIQKEFDIGVQTVYNKKTKQYSKKYLTLTEGKNGVQKINEAIEDQIQLWYEYYRSQV